MGKGKRVHDLPGSFITVVESSHDRYDMVVLLCLQALNILRRATDGTKLPLDWLIRVYLLYNSKGP